MSIAFGPVIPTGSGAIDATYMTSLHVQLDVCGPVFADSNLWIHQVPSTCPYTGQDQQDNSRCANAVHEMYDYGRANKTVRLCLQILPLHTYTLTRPLPLPVTKG